MSEQKHTCEELSKGSTWERHPCGRPAKYQERKWGELKWFCGMHAPSERQKRQVARDLKAKPARDAQAARWRLNSAAPDLLEALKAVYEHEFVPYDQLPPDKRGRDWRDIRVLIESVIQKAEGR